MLFRQTGLSQSIPRVSSNTAFDITGLRTLMRCLISPRWVLKSELVIIQSFAFEAARSACVEV